MDIDVTHVVIYLRRTGSDQILAVGMFCMGARLALTGVYESPKSCGGWAPFPQAPFRSDEKLVLEEESHLQKLTHLLVVMCASLNAMVHQSPTKPRVQ